MANQPTNIESQYWPHGLKRLCFEAEEILQMAPQRDLFVFHFFSGKFTFCGSCEPVTQALS